MNFACKRRENTFRIDYAGVPKKPSFEELHHFVGGVLGLGREDVERIQCSRNLGCAFVKTSDLATAQRVVAEHDNKHELVVEGKAYKLRIQMEDGAVEVKLFDLSEDVTDQQIADFLSDFGDVLSIHEQLWDEKYTFGGLPTGVRVARMMVKRNIPSYVMIDGEKTCLAYYGQQQTCKHCGESIHNGISCIQNKKLLVQKLAVDQGKSYASVAKQPRTLKPLEPKPPMPKPVGPSTPKPQVPKQKESTKKIPMVVLPRALPDKQKQEPIVGQSQIPPPSSVAPEAAFKQPSQPLKPSAEVCKHPASGGKDDGKGDETDESSTSSNGTRLRPRPPKKMKHNNGDDSQDKDLQL